ncbi:MAG: hypothetical protein AB1608_10655 [Thermoproteota archaeon]
MNNEIGRKLTSLTLMTIMLAAGFTAFAPSTMPEAAAANANLFVSAENSQFQNYFAGPMVIEVVVIDSDIKDTDEAKGEPDVTVNGNKLRMVQASDGNWYAYFADRLQAQRADQTVVTDSNGVTGLPGFGLDFGEFCGKDDGDEVLGFSVSQTVGVAIATNVEGGTNGTTAITDEQCTDLGGSLGDSHWINVVRENKTVNSNSAVPVGQIGFINRTFADQTWPFVQLYDFTVSGNVIVQYNKGGGVQSTTLKFDTVEGFIQEQLDRSSYPRGGQVHYTVTDIGLNIDPTDEDSWTFQADSSNKTTHYQVFDENGLELGDAIGEVQDITDSLADLMVEDGFELSLNVDTQSSGTDVVRIQDNANVVINSTQTSSAAEAAVTNGDVTGYLDAGTLPITLTELAPNTAIFSTYDETDTSQIEITSDAPRGKSATIEYDDPLTVLVGFGFGTIDIQPGDSEWNSGEEIPVVITDSDANKNSRADEDLDFNNPEVDLIPALSIGDPFTLGEAGVESAITYPVAFVNMTNLGTDVGGNSTLTDLFVLTAGESPTKAGANMTVQRFSERGLISGFNTTSTFNATGVIIDLETTSQVLFQSIKDPRSATSPRFHGFNLLNIDLRGLNSTITASDVWLLYTGGVNSTGILGADTDGGGGYQLVTSVPIYALELANGTSAQQLFVLNRTSSTDSVANSNADIVVGNVFEVETDRNIGLLVNFTTKFIDPDVTHPIGIDFFSFGFFNDGLVKSDRVNNYIARIEAEETGDNTAVFEGSLEYVMLNQLNILDASTYSGLSPIGDDPTFIAHQDLDDEEAPRVNYLDLGADGVSTQIADQEDAPAHSGVVSFDKPTYKIADTVTVTLEDQDLNVDVDLIDIYTVVNSTGDVADSVVGEAGLPSLSDGTALGRLLDITFDDLTWVDTNDACSTTLTSLGITDVSLRATGFSLIETGTATGIFRGDFQVPSKVCVGTAPRSVQNTQGLDMEVNYVDFRDASGQIIEVGDGAGIRANTGSVSLDRTVYPVPWGGFEDFTAITGSTPTAERSIFPLHLTAITADDDDDIAAAETLDDGILTIHVQVNDPDFDVSATGEDTIAQNTTTSTGATTNRGPVKVTISRGVSEVTLAYAGGDRIANGLIDVDDDNTSFSSIRQLGPITETSPSSGIFEFDLNIQYSDGPASDTCPSTDTFDSLASPGATSTDELTRFDEASATGDFCILQGDIITVEYTDPADASGDINTVTDSATFDLRNGALQSDKSVYIIGSDMILTLIEPDFDLDNDLAETYSLDLIEWDSDAATVSMGTLGGEATTFDPEPSNLRETGDSTGIFQVVIEIPSTLGGDRLERGEEIVLEYTDWGPSGADFVGQEDEDINLTIFTSNFGATVELDQKVYTWTDKVYITVVAPDHNFDSNLIDEIGESSTDPLDVATRGNKLDNYKLVETGTDTGIFTGEVILTGFTPHDADGDGDDTDASGTTSGTGPTDGLLAADDDDGLTVSYEFSEDETVVGSALIRWNIGEVTWLEASYPASGTGVVRVIDPDMNLNPEAVDNFGVDVWSDSDAGGIDLTVTETNEATGIFEGTVFFTTTDESSGHRLRVAEGDTVTAEYEDNTLPDPYTTADELDISGTAFIGTVVPPLERAPASNARVVDAFGNTLDEVSVDQQVQITADLTNGQDREQPFAYLVQIQDEDGVTVSLAWITGSLSAGQSFSPALSWTPTAAGTYTATVFVWESVDNPTALSPPVEVTIDVS